MPQKAKYCSNPDILWNLNATLIAVVHTPLLNLSHVSYKEHVEQHTKISNGWKVAINLSL